VILTVAIHAVPIFASESYARNCMNKNTIPLNVAIRVKTTIVLAVQENVQLMDVKPRRVPDASRHAMLVATSRTMLVDFTCKYAPLAEESAASAKNALEIRPMQAGRAREITQIKS
jgi:hypothetical protein